jgi:hypothetical protein
VQGKQIVYDARAKPVDESSATESAAVAKTKKKKGKQLPPEPIVNEQATGVFLKTIDCCHDWFSM